MAEQRCFTLGSASPRRSDLLAAAGMQFDVETVDIDEAALIDRSEPDPVVIVERIARAKFQAFPTRPSHTKLLTADTLVACNGLILGKPESRQHQIDMLAVMSGRSVEVVTAVCVGDRGNEPNTAVVSTTVLLRALASDEIEQYVETGVGMDKAAGLALQAHAKPFIHSVDGCWSNVLGLPVCAATAMLHSQDQPGDPSTRVSADVLCSVQLCGRYDG